MGLLDGKTGIVTGSGQGIGRAIALSYAAEGARVVVSDINDEMGNETVRLITDAGGTAVFVHCDVSDEESVKALVDAALNHYGRLDIACNSAALSRGSGPIHQYERAVFDQTLEMCLTNTWLCMKYEIAAMLETRGRDSEHLIQRIAARPGLQYGIRGRQSRRQYADQEFRCRIRRTGHPYQCGFTRRDTHTGPGKILRGTAGQG